MPKCICGRRSWLLNLCTDGCCPDRLVCRRCGYELVIEPVAGAARSS